MSNIVLTVNVLPVQLHNQKCYFYCFLLSFIDSESVTYNGIIISDESANSIKLMPRHTKLLSIMQLF